jgi:CubicO group peptidase (beta-lactamase class C family)
VHGAPRSCLAVALALSLAACGPAGFGGGASPAALERAAHEPATGAAGPGLERFDARIQSILERSGIPGASLAMARGGRLVLARGYGLADVAAGERVQPQTRFMLASVSKAITAVTVLKLVQEGRLSLDATVLPFLPAGEPPVDPRWQMITVEMLLRHEGGWNRRTSGDPLTWNVRVARALHVRRPVTPAQLARYMRGQPLDFTPGTEAVYSNFGYMLLGMIVERVAGAPYAEVVQSTTLVPMGITGLIDGAGRGERAYFPGEARRYGPDGRIAPGGLPPTHFASGAWIGSSVDLVRFLTAVDGTRTAPFLSAALTDRMLSPGPGGVGIHPNGGWFGMGWDNVQRGPDGVLFEKDGGLTGSMTWIEHDPSGVDWALFFNRTVSREIDQQAHREFVSGMRNTIAATTAWPELDLFSQY